MVDKLKHLDKSLHDNNINAIIVAYRPDLNKLYKLIDSLSQLKKIIIYKNSDFLIPSKFANVESIESVDNIGTAAAYNLSLNYLSRECEYVFILDQDSQLEINCIENLYSEAIKISKKEHYFLISPLETDNNNNAHGWGSFPIFNNSKISEVRSSGMFISSVVFKYIKFDENLFVDYVDWEFCWRAQKLLKLQIHKSTKSKILHELGSPYEVYFGKKLRVMSPNRIYSQIINSKILFFYSHVPVYKKILLIVRYFKLLTTCWIFKDFKNRYRFFFLGIFHNKVDKNYFK